MPRPATIAALAAAACALETAAAFSVPLTLSTSARAQAQRAPSALALRARADEGAAAALERRAALRLAVLAGPALLVPHQAAVAETEQKKSKKQRDEEYEEDVSGMRKVARACPLRGRALAPRRGRRDGTLGRG